MVKKHLYLFHGCRIVRPDPIVLKSEHLQSLKDVQGNKTINTILQLRLHPSIIALKERYKNTKKTHNVDLSYITPRGLWYDYSWKGDIDKSGGVASNIGVHFFDMLIWIFGKVLKIYVKNTDKTSIGTLLLKNATVNFKLSIDRNDLPWNEWKPFRSIKIDSEEIEFSEGFTDLHNLSYQNIICCFFFS